MFIFENKRYGVLDRVRTVQRTYKLLRNPKDLEILLNERKKDFCFLLQQKVEKIVILVG